MCSLVMSLHSRDISINNNNFLLYITLIKSHSTWFLDGRTSTCLNFNFLIAALFTFYV